MLREFESPGMIRVIIFLVAAVVAAIVVVASSPTMIQADYSGVRSFLH